jgi:ethanolaminephosphotransferase
MISAGYYGPGIWQRPIAELVGYPEILGDSSVIDIWIPMLLVSFFVAHLPACVSNVVKARRAQSLPVAPVFLEWTPMAVYTGAIGAWLYSPHSTLMRENRLVLFCLTMSFVFGRLTTKIILAHLTRQPFPYWTVMLVPLLGGAVLGNLPRIGLPAVSAEVELWYLRAYFVFAMVAYFRWALLVINSICAYLGINCLTITDKSAPGQCTSSEKRALNGSAAEEREGNGRISGKGD